MKKLPVILLGVIFFSLTGFSFVNAGTPISQLLSSRTITSPGYYYLTENILAENVHANGIEVKAGNVTIDLNGFTIDGNGHLSLIDDYKGNGIFIDGSDDMDVNNVEIRNGSIYHFGGFGIKTKGEVQGNRIINVRVLKNEKGGISLPYEYQLIKNCLLFYNLGKGIDVGGFSIITGNIITNRAGTGISTK